MAVTQRYVTQAASGGGAGTSGDPWTLTESMDGRAAPSDIINILSDSPYSLGATTILAAGNATGLIIYRGYNSTIGDLEGQGRNVDGTLNTTGFPLITLTGTLTPASYVSLKNLSFTSAISSSIVLGDFAVDNWSILSCESIYTGTSASTYNVVGDNGCTFINCDFSSTGGTHNPVFSSDLNTSLVGCRIESTANDNNVEILTGCIIECTIIGNNTGTGVLIEGANVGTTMIKSTTFYNLSTAVKLTSQAVVSVPVIIDCHATDNSEYINSLYSGTAANVVIEVNNRTRDNITPRTGIGDGFNVGEITTDTGGIETDYVNAGAGNLRLISGAPGESAALIAHGDVGAYQRVANGGGDIILPTIRRHGT